jgi:hypothetical protein
MELTIGLKQLYLKDEINKKLATERADQFGGLSYGLRASGQLGQEDGHANVPGVSRSLCSC